MKKVLFAAAIMFLGSISFYSCKSSDGGGCPAYGGNHVVKQVGKSL